MAVCKSIKTDNPVDDLEQQENIALGHQTGQDGTGRYGGIAISVRHPGMEREQSRLNRQAHGNDPCSTQLCDDDIQYVVEVLKEIVG